MYFTFTGINIKNEHQTLNSFKFQTLQTKTIRKTCQYVCLEHFDKYIHKVTFEGCEKNEVLNLSFIWDLIVQLQRTQNLIFFAQL